MPSTRPCAAFEPIPPDLDVNELVESTANFEYAVRIHCDMIDYHGTTQFERLVLKHVVLGGKPLVIEGYEGKLDRWIFAVQWLHDNCGKIVVDARDLTRQVNVPMTIGHYLNHMSLLTDQWTPSNYKDPERQRMYLKDIDCPQMWQERVADHIPPSLFYLNESTGDFGGLGSIDESNLNGSGTKRGRGIAKAGDLMSSLPNEMRAENLMCYIGHEGTFTPAHREMCASLGQNIMVDASTGGMENGKPTKPGSSIWFMTETKEREVVSEYWLSRLGHDIEVEKHFAQVNAWKNAPFKVYVVDQKPGDFILIPPLAPHQVWNRGTRTMKVAWNRTTVETLEMAMEEALFKARMVCRDEQYKNKAIIYYTLQKYAKALQKAAEIKQKKPESRKVQKAHSRVLQLQKDFKRLHALFTKILVHESFYADRLEKKVEMVKYDGCVTCSYCRANIFNRFLTCPSCVTELPDGSEDTYDICLDCYAIGRSCACISKLKWAEQWSWGELVQRHDQWRHLIIQHEGQISDKTPKTLKAELERKGKWRTVAQICQTELLKRPWRDIRQPLAIPDPVEEDVEVDAYGNVKKRKSKKSEKFQRDHGRCHVDCHWEPRWKQARCTKCDKNYCYGNLFRAYDMMPQDILANPQWKCPSCLKICNCRHCRRKPGWKLYTPKGTLLGHNTKAVADPRSVESLVDFSFSNIQWIEKAGDDYAAEDTRRLQRRRREANAAMRHDTELGEDYVDYDDVEDSDGVIESGLLRLAEQEHIPIDPNVGSGWVAANQAQHNGNGRITPQDEDIINENPEELSGDPLLENHHFSLPEGTTLQDHVHAYEKTDLITFTYPDPAMAPVPPAPVEGYQEAAAQLPYQEDEPLSPSKIEMVERKRKRKIDEGDKPFQYKAQSKKKSSVPKKRQSLVVSLAVGKDKLKEFEDAANIARAALEGIKAPAPVLGSDIQAFDVYASEDGQPPQKKVRRDAERPGPVENDTEYAPSRSRDRRKVPVDGTPLPPVDLNHERRATRLHNVTYAEPDEEEFNETIRPKSKLATMEQADILNSIEPDKDHESSATEPSSPKAAGKRPALAPSFTAKLFSEQDASHYNSRVATHSSSSPGSSATHSASKSMQAQAAANRRAKMAVFDADLDDIDDIDDLENDMSSVSDHIPDLPNELPASSAKATPNFGSRKAQPVILQNHGAGASMAYSTFTPASSVRAAADDWGDDSDSD